MSISELQPTPIESEPQDAAAALEGLFRAHLAGRNFGEEHISLVEGAEGQFFVSLEGLDPVVFSHDNVEYLAGSLGPVVRLVGQTINGEAAVILAGETEFTVQQQVRLDG